MNSETIYTICTDFINSFVRIEDHLNPHGLALAQYLMEYRTLALEPPRQVGKTTAMKKLKAKLEHSCVIVPNENMRRLLWRDVPDVLTDAQIKTHYPVMYGYRHPPYQYLLLDEQPLTADLFNPDGFGRRLSANTIIIALGTPTVHYHKR